MAAALVDVRPRHRQKFIDRAHDPTVGVRAPATTITRRLAEETA
jgi:hypothetical protein